MSRSQEPEWQRQQILLEQVKTLYQAMGSLLAINLLVCACLVFAFWNVVDRGSLFVWAGLMLLMIVVRAGIYWRFRQAFDATRLTLYRRFLVLGSASAGLIWGAGGLLLFSETDFAYQLFLLMALFTMAGGSTFSLSLYMPAYFAYVPATLIPISVKLLLMGGTTLTSLGIVTLVFLAALTSFNLRLNRNFSESLKLRFENLDLIEQLTVQKLEAERSNIAKSKFLAAASHDLRQPLYSLGLFTTVLDELVEGEKARQVLSQMRHSLTGLENLFNKLLDISQLDAGVVSPHKVSCSLKDLFASLELEFESVAGQKGVSIEWPTKALWARTDPVLLGQIMRNLVANAIRYTDNGQITISCKDVDGEIRIDVTDTGIGMSADVLDDIFGEFYQVDNTERDREKGLGLGLSIVQRCVALLGHTLSVRSEVGTGSVFSLTLEGASEAAVTAPSPKQKEIQSRFEFTPSTLVLVIDDEAGIREGTRQLLELWGCSVIAVEDDAQGLEQARAQDRMPTAIVSDYRLRAGRTGIEAIRAVKEQLGADIPALLITGDISQERLLELGVSNIAVLFKPVPPRKLREFLEAAAMT